MMDVKVSKDKYINKWVDWENLFYEIEWNRWNRIKKMCIKTKKVIKRGKSSKTMNEVKPVENISKNPQIFLEVSLVQKEALPLHTPQEFACR